MCGDEFLMLALYNRLEFEVELPLRLHVIQRDPFCSSKNVSTTIQTNIVKGGKDSYLKTCVICVPLQ